MPVRTIDHTEKDLTEHIATGDVLDEEMFEAQRQFFEKGPTRLQLWDLTECSMAGITMGGMRTFIEKATRFGKARKNGRTAVVVSTQLQYGLARMAETFTELASVPYEVQVFRSKEEAHAWLNEELEGDKR
jgi:hypothetical protein